jgi:hypothetical protein
MLSMANVDALITKFYCYEFFLVVPLITWWETSEKYLTERLFLAKRCLTRDTPAFGMLVGLLLLHFQCQLATIKPLTRGLSRRPDWAHFWLCAHAGAPENHSWSVQPRGPNSAANSTLGSLWGNSRCQWAVCSNGANLALVVPVRLLCLQAV